MSNGYRRYILTRIVVATGNKHKVDEIRSILCDLDIELLSLKDIGYTKDIVEDADTFAGNAMIKAQTICREMKVIALADDSGLCVEALGGEPGIHSARYASEDGKNSTDEENVKKLLLKLSGIPKEKRMAYFACSMALCFPDGRSFVKEGRSEGYITDKVYGENGFGYDPVFFCPQFGRTFGQMTAEEKNSVSHRKNALLQIAEVLRKEI